MWRRARSLNVFNLMSGSTEGFHTDNTLTTEIESLCAPISPLRLQYESQVPDLIAEGYVPPDTDTVDFFFPLDKR